MRLLRIQNLSFLSLYSYQKDQHLSIVVTAGKPAAYPYSPTPSKEVGGDGGGNEVKGEIGGDRRLINLINGKHDNTFPPDTDRGGTTIEVTETGVSLARRSP